MSEKIIYDVPQESSVPRIDIFLAGAMDGDFSRSYLQKLIKNGAVLVNGERVKPNRLLKPGEEVAVEIPEPEALDVLPEDIPLDIVYQDRHIAVINKSAGMVVHPGHGNWNGTLVNALLFHLKDLSSIGGVERPGIVHRLDKDTCGLMVVAKNDVSHRHLSEEFSERRVVKKYAAVVVGKPAKERGVIDLPIGRHRKYGAKMTVADYGREAVSEYRIEKVWSHRGSVFSLLEIIIHTGRTHQIRVHLSASGMPVVGDQIYSKRPEKYRVPYLLLQSKYLSFNHPENKIMEFEVPLAEHIQEFINRI